MGKKEETFDVQATGPIKHGEGADRISYSEGDVFTVTKTQADSLYAAGAIVKPGTNTAKQAAKDEKAALKTQAQIDEANALAESERKAAVGGGDGDAKK